VRYPTLPPLIAVVCGLAAATAVRAPRGWLPLALLLVVYLLAAIAFASRLRACLPLMLAGFGIGAWLLATRANQDALSPPLLATFQRLPPDAGPVSMTGQLARDATPSASGGVTLYIDAQHGGIVASVSGAIGLSRLGDWRAGRMIRVPLLLREPTVFRNPGLRDERLALARRRMHLFATVKSGALVDVVRTGGWWAERAADVRAFTRSAVERGVGRWSTQSAAIVVAILIGDRAGLDPAIERRLQEAGTYHVIAISGGNIAILAAVLLGVFWALGVRPAVAAWLTIVLLVAYADIAGGGASVNRATVMAAIYLVARMFDLRGAPMNALLATASALLVVSPLSIFDAAFLLTCGATLGILVAGRLFAHRLPAPWWFNAPAALLLASVSAELALLPVAASFFSRVTFAGLFLNFLAIPLMAVAQLAGMLVVPLALVSERLAAVAGWVAHMGAAGLVWSGSLVDLMPVLVWRVPPPPGAIIACYYLGWLLVLVRLPAGLPSTRLDSLRPGKPRPTTAGSRLRARGSGPDRPEGHAGWRLKATHAALRAARRTAHRAPRTVGLCLLVVSSIWILWSPLARWRGSRPTGLLRLTVVDVGQADCLLVRFPDGRAWLVDAGGSRAGGSFDVGGRVIEPVLWAHDVFGLHTFVLTHGDPDHIGGAAAIFRDIRVRRLWEGIDVPRDAAVQQLHGEAVRRGVETRYVRSGDREDVGGVHVTAWHPPPPDWQRQKVRNDDSVVLDLRFGDVSFVLTGDIGKDVERVIARTYAGAPLTVLKVPHHGSAGSSSSQFLAAVHPRLAVFTVGSQPVPSLAGVVARYDAIDALVFKTGDDGAVEVETDGREVRVVSFAGRRAVLRR
jgi:competence protein ComEC